MQALASVTHPHTAPHDVQTSSLAHWLLAQEARAMLRRIDRVKPFALQETMLPAAAPMPATLVAIERYLIQDRTRLRNQVQEFIEWMDAEAASRPAAEVQRRLTFLRLRFNSALTQLDIFFGGHQPTQ
jgi:hypothetical protein